MFEKYVLSPKTLAALAGGETDPRTEHQLLSAQVSADLLLTLHILQSASLSERVQSAVHVLSEAQKLAPEETGRLYHDCWSTVWAARCLAALEHSGAATATFEELTLRVGAVAAVAALHAGIDAQTWTVCDSGQILLPTLGVASVSGLDQRFARITVHDRRITIECGQEMVAVPAGVGVASPGWTPTRRLAAQYRDCEARLIFDDIDPLRDCYGMRPEQRVSADRYSRWRQGFSVGWWLLCRYAPHRACQVSRGIRVLVPLADSPRHAEVSVSSQDAAGALAMTLPAHPASFAIALVHEQAHSTLNGLLSMVKLFEEEGPQQRYFAPWRPDPRPVGGLIHGAFAFLAVAETWLALAEHQPLHATALQEFTLRRAQLDPVLDTLATAEALTANGKLFAAAMRRRCDSLLAVAAPPEYVARAADAVRAQHFSWRKHHQQPP